MQIHENIQFTKKSTINYFKMYHCSTMDQQSCFFPNYLHICCLMCLHF